MKKNPDHQYQTNNTQTFTINFDINTSVLNQEPKIPEKTQK